MSPLLPAGARLLVEFRAGRLLRDGTTAKPDPRKGLLRVVRTEDGLLHVQWYQRGAADAVEQPEYDEIVFPEEAHFEAPAGAPPRVFMLAFREQSERNVLFWMQEPSTAHDEQLRSAVDAAVNTPMGADWDDGGEDDGDGAALLPTDALLRAAPSSTPGAGEPVVAGDSVGLLPSGPGQQQQAAATDAAALAALLSGIAGGGAAGLQAAGGEQLSDPGASLAAALLSAVARQRGVAQRAGRAPGPGLAEVLRPDVLAPLLSDTELAERLAPHLPEGQRSSAALSALAHSPSFQQQLGAFSAALQTGQLDLTQFGLRAAGFTAADFLAAIQDLVERERLDQQQQQ